MAGDWIKFEKITTDKPEVFEMASILGIDPDSVVGKLLRIWSWFDDHSKDGHASVTLLSRFERDTNVTGFIDAMIKVGWMEKTDTELILSNFDRHHGQTAKTRALSANRKQNERSRHDSVTKMSRSERDKSVTREEKRREENKEVCAGSLGNSELWPPSTSPDAASGEAHQPTSTPKNAPRMPQDPFESSERTQTSAAWFEALKSRVNGLKSEWQKPARWSYAEDRLLADGVASQMDELDDSDWALLGRYLSANTSTDSTYWKPRTRGKFVETFPDVMESARRWAGKNGVAVRATISADLLNNPVYR